MKEVIEEELKQHVEEKEPERKKKHPVRNLIIFGSVVGVLAGGITLGSYLLRDQYPEVTKKANQVTIVLNDNLKKNGFNIQMDSGKIKNCILCMNGKIKRDTLSKDDLFSFLGWLTNMNDDVYENWKWNKNKEVAISYPNLDDIFDENHQKEKMMVEKVMNCQKELLTMCKNREAESKIIDQAWVYAREFKDIIVNDKPIDSPIGKINYSSVNSAAKYIVVDYTSNFPKFIGAHWTTQESYDNSSKMATIDGRYQERFLEICYDVIQENGLVVNGGVYPTPPKHFNK